MTPIEAIEVRIQGRVQGVGYRYFAQGKALELGLMGWIRNRPDGDVEGAAQGPKEALERWIEHLKIGPTLSRVNAVNVTWTSLEKRNDRQGIAFKIK